MVDLLADVHTTNFLWQVGALLLSIALAWWAARWVRARIGAKSAEDRPEQGIAVKIGLRGVSRVLFPLCALILVAVARALLRYRQPEVALLNVAIPLLSSLLLVRVVMYVLHHVFSPSTVLRTWERTVTWAVWKVANGTSEPSLLATARTGSARISNRPHSGAT